MTSNLYDQIKDMCKLLYSKNINIDYYPTNFIVRNVDNKLFYIDYECNIYDENGIMKTGDPSIGRRQKSLKRRLKVK